MIRGFRRALGRLVLAFGFRSILWRGIRDRSWAGIDPSPIGLAFAALLVPVLCGAVFAAVYHAEIIAHRTGEPYGTLVLTIAVTVIEVALIIPGSCSAGMEIRRSRAIRFTP